MLHSFQPYCDIIKFSSLFSATTVVIKSETSGNLIGNKQYGFEIALVRIQTNYEILAKSKLSKSRQFVSQVIAQNYFITYGGYLFTTFRISSWVFELDFWQGLFAVGACGLFHSCLLAASFYLLVRTTLYFINLHAYSISTLKSWSILGQSSKFLLEHPTRNQLDIQLEILTRKLVCLYTYLYPSN